MRILVVGAAGHVGAAVAEHFAATADVIATTRAELDVREHRAVEAMIGRLRPAAVINCSAYTDVDRAEDEPMEALNVNAFAVRVLARAARAAGAVFVHYSTDFVFDGTSDRPYTEDDQPNPRSTYACSKLIGEWFAREAGRHYVLRVESVFGSPPAGDGARRTSVDRIVDAILAGREASVFVDRTVSPSYHRDVAAATHALLVRQAPPGLYHCVNSGSCTWEQLAREAGRQLGLEPLLKLVRVADVGLRARRPRYCALSNAKLAATGVAMSGWQDALGRYLATRRQASARP
ncbi:MAG TPA: dTDP-4-dehydrorhamnose reductase [Vicinamibacterales bacterium]